MVSADSQKSFYSISKVGHLLRVSWLIKILKIPRVAENKEEREKKLRENLHFPLVHFCYKTFFVLLTREREKKKLLKGRSQFFLNFKFSPFTKWRRKRQWTRPRPTDFEFGAALLKRRSCHGYPSTQLKGAFDLVVLGLQELCKAP